MRELLAPDVMDQLIALLAPDLDRQKPGGGHFLGTGQDRRVDALRTPRRSPDPDGHDYRANAAGSIQICGGGPDQVLHREMDNYWPDMKHDPAKHECILQLAWAGIAKHIAPGIHLCEFGRRRSPAKSLRP